jgi:nitroreductase
MAAGSTDERNSPTMTDTLDLLATRRSVAPIALSDPGPRPDELERLLTIAARVPDHGKLAPWRFIVFEGDARKAAGERIAAVFAMDNPDADEARLDVERKRFMHAPLIVGVVSRAAPHVKIPEWEQVLSAGAVCMNLVVAAHGMGFAASWLTQWYAYDRRVLETFGLAPHEKMAGFVHIGRARNTPEDRERPALSRLVTRFGA